MDWAKNPLSSAQTSENAPSLRLVDNMVPTDIDNIWQEPENEEFECG